jgi:protein TonB
MLARKSRMAGAGRRVAIASVALAALVAAGYGVFAIVTDKSTSKKRVMETVQLTLVPPPPPPKVEPPPPEPPKIVEQKIEPPAEKPEDKPKEAKSEAPPPGPLALDAKGGPGGDAFGLMSKEGGADYLGGTIGGGGGPGDGMRWAGYSAMMQEHIGKRLHEDDELDVRKFRLTLKIWLTSTGKVHRVEILHTAGDARIDDRVRHDIAGMSALPEAPSPEMPQPVIVRIGARPASES